MRVLDLFSGVGGFGIATHLLGMEPAAFVEWDDKCQAILRLRFPGVPIYGDITTLTDADLAALGPIGLVCGGPPCQPVSVAGQRRGAADDRWLWPEMVRVVAAVRPRYVVAENPGGFVTMGLATVVPALECLGYHVRHVEVPACATEADHERQRVWILAVAHADAHGQGQPQSGGTISGQRGWAGDGGAAAGRDGVGLSAEGGGADAHGGGRGAGQRDLHAGQSDAAGICAVPIGRTPHGDVVAGVRRVADGTARGMDGPHEHRDDNHVGTGTTLQGVRKALGSQAVLAGLGEAEQLRGKAVLQSALLGTGEETPSPDQDRVSEAIAADVPGHSALRKLRRYLHGSATPSRLSATRERSVPVPVVPSRGRSTRQHQANEREAALHHLRRTDDHSQDEDVLGGVPLRSGAAGRRHPVEYPEWLLRPQPSGLTGRSADRSTRLKQLGNAAHWPVVYEILRPIAIAEGLVPE